MITLNELFEVTWDITELNITARAPDSHFLHEWLFGEYVHETIHMRHEREAGNLTISYEKINAHGDPARSGCEIGWGVKEKLIPKELREAPITHLQMSPMCRSKGTRASVDVEMQELTVMTITNEEKTEEI